MSPSPAQPLTGGLRLKRAALAAVPTLAVLGTWWAIAIFLWSQGIFFCSTDDFPRMTFALGFSDGSCFVPADYFWPPLPMWVYGAWHRLAGRLFGLCWHIPLTATLLGLATVGVQQLTMRTLPFSCEKRRFIVSQIAPPLLALLLILCTPYAWRLSVSALSEPLHLAVQASMLVCLCVVLIRPRPLAWAGLLGLAVAGELIRYEAWPLGAWAWLLGVLGTPGEGWSRRQRLTLLLSGAAVLAIYPLLWMGLNFKAHGDPFHFLNVTKEALKTEYHIQHQPLALRLAHLGELARRQGWLILPLAAWGIWLGRWERLTRMLALYGLGAWAIYFQGAFAYAHLGVSPERFCLGPLWAMVPLAARPLLHAGISRTLRLGLVALVLWLGARQASLSQREHWGGTVLQASELRDFANLRRLAHERDRLLVVDDAEQMGCIINTLRVYAGVERVAFQAWFTSPRFGRFAYLTRRRHLGERMANGVAFGPYYYFLLDEMPLREEDNDHGS